MPLKWKSSPGFAVAGLIAMTAIWGWTFLIVKDAIAKMPVMDFLAVRFAVAAIVMLAVRPAGLRHIGRRGLWHGAVIGFLLGMSYHADLRAAHRISGGFRIYHRHVGGFYTGFFLALFQGQNQPQHLGGRSPGAHRAGFTFPAGLGFRHR